MGVSRWLGLFGLTLLLVLPTNGFAQKNGKDKGMSKVEKATAQEYMLLQQVREIVGKLVVVEDKGLSLRVETQSQELNPAFKPSTSPALSATVDANKRTIELENHLKRINTLQREIATAKDAKHRQKLTNQLNDETQRANQAQQRILMDQAKANLPPKADAKNQPYRLVTTTRDFDLDLDEKVYVRCMNPPKDYDDKGYLKTYDKAKLEEMRGKDKTKPGLEAKYEDLASGQLVKLTLTPIKKSETKKNAKDDDDVGVGNVARPTVNMIVILDDSGPALTGPSTEKKKNKK